MKRGKALRRGGPLARKSRLAPGPKGLARGRGPARTSRIKPISEKHKRAMAKLRRAKAVVRRRSGGWCEAPGCTRIADDYHHVTRRSRGGEHTAENLVHWCRWHHDAEHFGGGK